MPDTVINSLFAKLRRGWSIGIDWTKRAYSTAIRAARHPLGHAVISYLTLVYSQYFATYLYFRLCTEFGFKGFFKAVLGKTPFCGFLLKFMNDCESGIQVHSKAVLCVNAAVLFLSVISPKESEGCDEETEGSDNDNVE